MPEVHETELFEPRLAVKRDDMAGAWISATNETGYLTQFGSYAAALDEGVDYCIREGMDTAAVWDMLDRLYVARVRTFPMVPNVAELEAIALRWGEVRPKKEDGNVELRADES